jgi:hypothetical protein
MEIYFECVWQENKLKGTVQRDESGPSAAGSELPTAVRGGAKFLKGSHRMGDGRIVLKPPRLSL